MSRTLPAALVLLCAACSTPSAPAPCRLAPLCLCHSDHFVCNDVPFYEFPPVEPGVIHVSVSGAHLGALSATALAGCKLSTLLLHADRLYHLHPHALASTSETLASLDLGYNELTEIPMSALQHLRVLHWLNLQNNHIGSVSAAMQWGGLSDSLTSLSLANNELVTLDSESLAGLHRLARLDLEGNRLRILMSSALPLALASLQLSRNLLPSPPCVDLPRLVQLGLRDNMFVSMTPCNNLSPHRLDTLDLSNNRLSSTTLSELLQHWSVRHLLLDMNELEMMPRALFESPHLERLSLTHNRITTLSGAGLRRLHHLQHLELDHNEIRELPIVLRDLMRCRLLSLAYNHLMEVSALPPRLHSLILAGNYLEIWPEAALSAMYPGELRRLDLGYNRLMSLAPDAWGPWASALETLDLRSNHLVALAAPPPVTPLEPVLTLPPLRELLLGFNDMYSLRYGALEALAGSLRVLELSTSRYGGEFPVGAALAGLEWLALDNSEVHAVSAHDLAALPALQVLNLDFNRLERFPTEVSPSHLPPQKLRELRLAYNILRDVEWQYLSASRELRGLDLSHNELRELPPAALRALPLRHLRLGGNRLAYLAPNSLSHLPYLALLELQQNELTELSTTYFEDVGDIEGCLLLNASHNRISILLGSDAGDDEAKSRLPLRVGVLDLSNNRLTALSSAFIKSIATHLRRFVVSHNFLHSIELLAVPIFSRLLHLQELLLQYNNITILRPLHAPSLALLDLRYNSLQRLPSALLAGTPQLTRLLLAGNMLRVLPRNALEGAPLEYVDLSDNRVAVFPAGALGTAGRSLRRLELGGNTLEHLDAAMFTKLAALRELGLARNSLTVLPDNTFAALPLLRRLDLARNTLKTNFKELFHNLPGLRALRLAGCGLRILPRLPLPNLTHLDIADNHVSSWRDTDLRDLAALRELVLSRNEVVALRAGAWGPLSRLVALDLADNPLLALPVGGFDQLPRLQRLRLSGLRGLERVEAHALRPLLALRSLEVDVPAGDALPSLLLAQMPQVEALTLHVRIMALEVELAGLDMRRLHSLEVRGAALRRVAAGAFAEVRGVALSLRVSGTALTALPADLLALPSPLLALDLSDNRLTALSPAVLYTNLTDWHRRGTTMLPGGFVISGNPLQCGCGTQWLGAWLRRWASETGAGARVPAAVCWHHGTPLPLVKVHADAAECAASALSSSACPRYPLVSPSALLGLILLLIVR